MTVDALTDTIPAPRPPSEPTLTDREEATAQMWADLAGEPRDADPVVAEVQEHRDRLAATGQWEYAEQAQARIDLWRVDPLAGLPDLDYTPDPPEPG